MKHLWSGVAALGILIGTSAVAGPVSDFEAAFRQMYGTYRAALFKTNAGQQAESSAAVSGLSAQLAALADRYGETPPPQYQDDPLWGTTMDKALELVGTAKDQVEANELPQAHETLEGVRDLFGDMHTRNGIETFSDRMNAYHAAMEHLLAVDLSNLDDGALGMIREQAAVLSYLAQDVLAAPPLEAAGNGEYEGLAAAFDGSVKDLLSAARSGDADQVRAATGKLKVPYSKFFLKFG